jgi:hypothetical protein
VAHLHAFASSALFKDSQAATPGHTTAGTDCTQAWGGGGASWEAGWTPWRIGQSLFLRRDMNPTQQSSSLWPGHNTNWTTQTRKVQLCLGLIKHAITQRMKKWMYSSTCSWIFTILGPAVSFTPRPLYPRGEDTWLGEASSRSECCGQDNNLSCRESNPRFPGWPTCSLNRCQVLRTSRSLRQFVQNS